MQGRKVRRLQQGELFSFCTIPGIPATAIAVQTKLVSNRCLKIHYFGACLFLPTTKELQSTDFAHQSNPQKFTNN